MKTYIVLGALLVASVASAGTVVTSGSGKRSTITRTTFKSASLKSRIALGALLAVSASVASADAVVTTGIAEKFELTKAADGKPAYTATFGYDASQGYALKNAIGTAVLQQLPTGGNAVWAHVPVVKKGTVTFVDVQLPHAMGNGGGDYFQSSVVLPLNAKNAAAAKSEGISFYSKTADGSFYVWYQNYAQNAKLAP